jgi:hypothetical protein
MRVAPGNPFVPEEEWVGVPCETCHHVDENGIVTPGIAWLNPITMDYVEVNTSTELCEKCHVTTNGNSFGSAVSHKVTLGGSAHLNYGGFIGDEPPPSYCAVTEFVLSHSIVYEVACDRCHFADNVHGLTVYTADGEVPEPPAEETTG